VRQGFYPADQRWPADANELGSNYNCGGPCGGSEQTLGRGASAHFPIGPYSPSSHRSAYPTARITARSSIHVISSLEPASLFMASPFQSHASNLPNSSHNEQSKRASIAASQVHVPRLMRPSLHVDAPCGMRLVIVLGARRNISCSLRISGLGS
jgi:hypothetical protein